MKNPQGMTNLLIALCVVGFLLTVADFLALTDISHDFVGSRVQDMLGSGAAADLPEWTETRGEWGLLRLSWLFRLLFFVFCAAVLCRLAERRKTGAPVERAKNPNEQAPEPF